MLLSFLVLLKDSQALYWNLVLLPVHRSWRSHEAHLCHSFCQCVSIVMIDPFFPSYDVWSAGETETECHSTMNWMNSDSATQQYAPKGKVGAAVLGNRETRKVKSASWMTVSSHLSVSLVRALLVNLPPAVSAARLRDLEQSPHQSCDWRKIRLHCDIFILVHCSRSWIWTFLVLISLRLSQVQPGLYAAFYDEKMLSWSLRFDTQDDLTNFTREVALAKAAASNFDSLVSQELVLGEGAVRFLLLFLALCLIIIQWAVFVICSQHCRAFLLAIQLRFATQDGWIKGVSRERALTPTWRLRRRSDLSSERARWFEVGLPSSLALWGMQMFMVDCFWNWFDSESRLGWGTRWNEERRQKVLGRSFIAGLRLQGLWERCAT